MRMMHSLFLKRKIQELFPQEVKEFASRNGERGEVSFSGMDLIHNIEESLYFQPATLKAARTFKRNGFHTAAITNNWFRSEDVRIP